MNTNEKPKSRRLLMTARERQLILVLGDLVVSILALLISLYFWAQSDPWTIPTLEFLRERPPLWFYLQPFIWIVINIDLYDVRKASNRRNTIQGIIITTFVATSLYLVIYFTSEPNTLPRRGVAVFIAAIAVLSLLWRLIYIRVFTSRSLLRRVLIIGAGRSGGILADITKDTWPPPYNLIGFIDDDKKKIGKEVSGYPVLGDSADLLRVIDEHEISDLIFSISGEMKPETFSAILQAKENGIDVTTMPITYEELIGRVPIFLLEDDWILRTFVDHARSTASYETLKRIVDLFFAFVGLIGLGLLYPFIALAVFLDGGTPILYRQERVGANGKTFELLKFRTMRQDAEKDGKARMAVENDERVTTIGRFLRKSHLDELPQFINVIKGDISMVGPRAERPTFVDQLEKDIPFYRARLFVKPGVTGWAQINYQYASNVEENANKLEYDLYYIKHRNIGLDISIILRTAGQIIGLRGV